MVQLPVIAQHAPAPPRERTPIRRADVPDAKWFDWRWQLANMLTDADDVAQLFALTSPLITTSSGAKMGKTASGAIWLDANLLSPYDYWQYWRNTEDGDVARFLKLFTILPLDAGADRHYAAIRTSLEKKGTPIGANDMLIAAHARAIAAVCVTANVAEFKRVPALKIENWLA